MLKLSMISSRKISCSRRLYLQRGSVLTMLGQQTQRPTILIVDDTLDNVIILQAIFEREGFVTLSADSGAACRRIAYEQTPDLILLDVMMPEEDGFETCKKLKSDPATSDIPIIFVTALNDTSHKVGGLSIGAVDYITKPFNKEEVLARARLHIKLSQATRAVVSQQLDKLQQIHDAQEALLTQPQDFPEANFAVYYKSFHEAGGDFYDIIRISDSIFGFFVADVSGHDIGSSYATAALKVLLSQNSSSLFTPQDTIKIINKGLCSFLKDGVHVTASYARLNRVLSQLTVSSCGHVPMIYLHCHTGGAEVIQCTGDILGVFDPVIFEVQVMKTKPGDRIFLYTDGLIEDFSASRSGRSERILRLASECTATRAVPLADAVRGIADKLTAEKRAVQDDILLLGIEV